MNRLQPFFPGLCNHKHTLGIQVTHLPISHTASCFQAYLSLYLDLTSYLQAPKTMQQEGESSVTRPVKACDSGLCLQHQAVHQSYQRIELELAAAQEQG